MLGCDVLSAMLSQFASNFALSIPWSASDGRYPFVISSNLFIKLTIMFLSALLNFSGHDSIMPGWALLAFKPTVVYLPWSSVTGILVFPLVLGDVFALCVACRAAWMKLCHGTKMKMKSLFFSIIWAPSMVSTIVRSSVVDKMQPFGGQFGIILSDVPLKKTGWFFKISYVIECSGKDMTYFSLFIFFIFFQWHFIAFLVCGMLCFTVALWAARTWRLEEVFVDLFTC